jgi:hypothetical protein
MEKAQTLDFIANCIQAKKNILGLIHMKKPSIWRFFICIIERHYQ